VLAAYFEHAVYR